MARVEPISILQTISGKVPGSKDTHFYNTKTGKSFTRKREETYQRNQSPRQRWNSAAFAYAHAELRRIESDPALTEQMNADYEAAAHRAPNGRTYLTAHAWQFNTLLHAYKTAHPFTD